MNERTIDGSRQVVRPSIFLSTALAAPTVLLAGTALVSFGYRLGASAKPPIRAAEPPIAMPAAAPSDVQSALYLTPRGLYTMSDIRANGSSTAAERFRGQMARHDPHPLKGDRVCPITDTKANPQFSWVVGGRTYRFCCPACIDEFVSRAETKPGSIRSPDEYVK